MEQRNEPSMGEIVRALRNCVNGRDCEECRYSTGTSAECLDLMNTEAADRLEQLERERVRITDELTAMTARAEKAEAERDAAIDCARGLCELCKHREVEYDEEPCISCLQGVDRARPNWKWRGLRGKENDGKD